MERGSYILARCTVSFVLILSISLVGDYAVNPEPLNDNNKSEQSHSEDVSGAAATAS